MMNEKFSNSPNVDRSNSKTGKPQDCQAGHFIILNIFGSGKKFNQLDFGMVKVDKRIKACAYINKRNIALGDWLQFPTREAF
jgi:hypothetical protein